MQTSRMLLITAYILATSSCGSSGKRSEDGSFYPALSVISSEMHALDSLPLAVIRYSGKGTETDTSIVEKPDFKTIAELAFSPDISKPPLNRLYREEVFLDQTLNRVVLRYGTEEPDAVVSLLEITLDPDSEKVRSMYIEKQVRRGDTMRTVKSVWTVGRQLQTSVIGRVGDKPLPDVKERFVWGLPQ